MGVVGGTPSSPCEAGASLPKAPPARQRETLPKRPARKKVKALLAARRHLMISWDEGQANGMVDLRVEVRKGEDTISELLRKQKDRAILVTFTKDAALGPLRPGFDLLSLRLPLSEKYMGFVADVMAGAYRYKPQKTTRAKKVVR